MRLVLLVTAIAAFQLVWAQGEDQRALFVKNEFLQRGKRETRQSNADQMVQNILQWLQGVYTQNSRRIRQGSLREYLPPTNTQKPRPFEPVSTTLDGSNGYPPAGITPQPPFPIYTNPATGGITGPERPGYPAPNNEITAPDQPGYPGSAVPGTSTQQPGYGGSTLVPGTTPQPQPGSTLQPGYSTTTQYPGYNGVTTPVPSQPGYTYPTPQPGFTTTTLQPQPGQETTPGGPVVVPEGTTGYTYAPPSTPSPVETTPYPQRPGFSTGPPPGYTPQGTTGFPTQPPTGYTSPGPSYTNPPSTPAPGYTSGTEPTPAFPTYAPPSSETPSPAGPETTTPAETFTSAVSTDTTPSPRDNDVVPPSPDGSASTIDEDLKHPPHIHAINVVCAKDMMTINIEFNREFNGVIYSKGYYNMPECRYVKENSGQSKYSFTVSLNSCGTEFVNAFDTQGQSYLENVLVLQNEAGIQEVWDTIRSVRCLWEGNLKDTLSVALSVGMLTQEIVTFSGDTAMAKLDIQVGKGPFAPAANGLVKIGETMTLVVSVSGDPGFDLQVKDCRATDSTGGNVVPLTDDNGCVLKPKLFGAFQKTRNTGNTGASIIAYAFFSAFKFPDVMDLMIECNIELCKTDCEVCPNPNQQLEPGRRKRDLYGAGFNQSIGEGVTMGKHIRVVLPEDLSAGVLKLGGDEGVCMSTQSFVLGSAVLVSLLVCSSLFSGYVWLKNQRLGRKQ